MKKAVVIDSSYNGLFATTISNKHCIQAGLHDGLQGSIQAERLEMIKWDGIEVPTTFQGIH